MQHIRIQLKFLYLVFCVMSPKWQQSYNVLNDNIETDLVEEEKNY